MTQLPKPSSQRRRPGPPDRQLPAEGRSEPAPDLPGGDWSGDTLAWWSRIWASPMATAWIDADYDAAVRLARVREAILEHPEKAALHSAASQLEDRLGLSPRARRALGWRIVETPPADEQPTRARVVHAI